MKITITISEEDGKKAITEYVEKQTGMDVVNIKLLDYYDSTGWAEIELKKRESDYGYLR